jgi:hypothetical protein
MGTDNSAMSSASAVSVEDFFNSIELPLSDTADVKREPDVGKVPEFVKQSSPEPIYVDEAIPGFGRNAFSETDRTWSSKNNVSLHPDMSPPRSGSASERSFSVERDKGPSIPSLSSENLPIRSRSDGTPHAVRDYEPDSRRSTSTPQPTAPIPRRGTKRPVAADFDTEPVAKSYTPLGPSRTGSGTGFSNGTVYHPNPHVRRKMNGAAAGGFASLNNTRRCVIDVSDSEDDASEDETPSRVPQAQGVVAGGAQLNARDSALALELEIERMRKIIREREEQKLRKQVVRGYRVAFWIMSCLTRAITMHRWCQVGQRLFLSPGNRRRCPELWGKSKWEHRHRAKTRSRDPTPATTKRPRMVRSFFSPHWESGSLFWALLGSEALVSQTGRQSRVTKACDTPIYHQLSRYDTSAWAHLLLLAGSARRGPPHFTYTFASARHFRVLLLFTNFKPYDRKQCWQVRALVRHPRHAWM